MPPLTICTTSYLTKTDESPQNYIKNHNFIVFTVNGCNKTLLHSHPHASPSSLPSPSSALYQKYEICNFFLSPFIIVINSLIASDYKNFPSSRPAFSQSVSQSFTITNKTSVVRISSLLQAEASFEVLFCFVRIILNVY